MIKAAYVDLKQGRKDQGASTLSMQLARSMWLGQDKSWKRKVEEIATRYEKGYGALPLQPGEFDIPDDERAWPEDWYNDDLWRDYRR